MRLLSLYFIFLFAAAPVERAIVDVTQTARISPPEAHSVSFTPPIHAGLGMPPLPPALSLRLVPTNDPANQKQGLESGRCLSLRTMLVMD